MNTKLSGAFALIFFFFFLSACQSYKKVPYLQDAEILKQANTQVAPVQDARLIPGDEVSILVSTSDPVVSQPFNAQGSTFLLDDQGNINYPVLGKLPLNGLTSREAENLITDRLKSYVKERPTVVVRMSGFKVSVLGEVASPGVYPVVNEQINVLEALAMAGDLTIYGVRDNVKLIREDKNGHKQFVTLSLNDADLLYLLTISCNRMTSYMSLPIKPKHRARTSEQVRRCGFRDFPFWYLLPVCWSIYLDNTI